MLRKAFCLVLPLLFLSGSLYAKAPGEITVALGLERMDGGREQQEIGTVPLAAVSKQGVWVSFRQQGNQTIPEVRFGGHTLALGRAVEELASLRLFCTYQGHHYDGVLFGNDKLYGSKRPHVKNVYHLLILDDFVTDQDLTTAPAGADPAAQAAWRIHQLALNYALQSDRSTRELAGIYQVAAEYRKPRLILVSEEWLDLPKEVQQQAKPRQSGGLFGGAMQDIADEIGGETKVEPEYLPTYGVNLLLDEIEADGRLAASFQTARSLWDDLLEGEVVYQATKGMDRQLTATVVFSQLAKNSAQPGNNNGLLRVDRGTLDRLDSVNELWPEAKARISAFLDEREGWFAVLPKAPVNFYAPDGKFQYAMLAWFYVDPVSGRMLGVTPNDAYGSLNEVWNKYEKKALVKAKEAIDQAGGGPASGAVKSYFSTLAGVYVSTAGLLSGINLTIADPSLANLSEEEWRRFLAQHALDFCSKFLEEQSDIYDSYDTIASFWMGACSMTSRMGGSEAAGKCLVKTYEHLRDKAIDDAKKQLDKQLDELKKEGGKIADQAVEEMRDGLAKDVVETLNDTRTAVEIVGNGLQAANEALDTIQGYQEDYQAVSNEIQQRMNADPAPAR